MKDYIIINRFMIKKQLEMKDSADGKCTIVYGGNIEKSYEKVSGISLHLKENVGGYSLSMNIPNKFTKKICNLLDGSYSRYECYFKAKIIETLIRSKIDCASYSEIVKGILSIENYLDSNEFYSYDSKVFLRYSEQFQSYENKVLYPTTAYLERIGITGGIIINTSSQLFDSLVYDCNNCIILTIGSASGLDPSNRNQSNGNISNASLKSIVYDINEFKKNDINEGYDRIFFDCSKIESIDKLIGILKKYVTTYHNIKSKHKWIIIREMPVIKEMILDLIDFLCGKKINYPIIDSRYNSDINLKAVLNGIILNLDNKGKSHAKVNIIRNPISFNECERYILEKLPKNISYDVLDELDILGSYMYITDLECPICADIIESEYLCKTICGHIFCIRCIILSLNEKSQCPICRSYINMNNVLINKIGKPSKLETIISEIKMIPKNMKAIIYIKNQILIKKVHNILSNDYNISAVLCIGTKQNKMRIINEHNRNLNSSIILIQSKDYELGRYITGIKYIIVSDFDYRYVTNRMTMGYDFYNNKSDIHLIILEYPHY